uniref:Transketolase n=1 Tax=Albugo laibachii Nc14 TaxID=890382 RepID=F0WFB2_9STRA|nr:Tkl1p putative [Albugo laibachii Nc14]|eukprot:CCA19894.1 Tkl1p putative [Albugo laibachii Nc14]
MEANDELCINTIRILSAEQPTMGKSGHPGAPMGMAPMAHILFGKFMHMNPKNPGWMNRDRFVLSNGHACALLYTMLHLTGYDVTIDDLKSFRQYGSKCPGHPECFATPGVEVTTGPLGQGFANGVGLAIAEKHMAAEFNRTDLSIIDHYTYVFTGDGCLQEGITSEASSLAGHLGLGKLIVLYDDNKISIDGHTDLAFTEDVLKRYEAYDWHVQSVTNGDSDYTSIYEAILNAKAVTDKPSFVKVTTTIGYGSLIENSKTVHGAPLKEDDLAQLKEKFGFKKEESFFVPKSVKEFYDKRQEGAELEKNWTNLFEKYRSQYPEFASEFMRRVDEKLPGGWKDKLPRYDVNDKPKATRQHSHEILNACAMSLPELVGGSADLTPSNLTALDGNVDFQKDSPSGRYIRFGVREHAMAGISNGIFAHGGLRPFCATFYNFLEYGLGAIRLSALSRFGIIYVATHDSIFLGEDGPTHQPIEMSACLRAMPNMYVYRPADGNETVGCYIAAIECRDKTSVVALSRQPLPNLEGSSAEKVMKGAYTVVKFHNGSRVEQFEGSADLIIAGTGSEVFLAIQAARLLSEFKVRVVSMPCRDLFDEQTTEYKKEVLGESIPVLGIEAAATFGWRDYSHAQFGLDRFGASASINQLNQHFGFNAETVADEARRLWSFYEGSAVPCLFNFPEKRILNPGIH